jgi:membrane associated rhomboid family serine protease
LIIVTLVVALIGTLAAGLVFLYARLTPNGPVWTNYQRLCGAQTAVFGLWLYDVLMNPARHADMDLRRWLTYAAVLVLSYHLILHARALRMELKR